MANLQCEKIKRAAFHGRHLALVVTCLGFAQTGHASPAAEARAAAAMPPEVTPEERQAADPLRAEGVKCFGAGDYPCAIRAFTAAYELSAAPADLFNLGRIHEEIGELPKALEYYETFIQQPHLALDERQRAAERIEVLRVAVGPSETEPTQAVPEESETPQSEPEPGVGTPARDDRSSGRPGALIATGSTLLVVGVVTGAAGGTVFGLRGSGARDDLKALEGGENPGRLSLADAEAIDQRGRNSDLLQGTFLGVGGALAITGVALLAVGIKRKSQRRSISVAPSFSRRNLGLTAHWKF